MRENNVLISESVLLYKGKCEDVMPELDKVDVVITSPPYNIGKDYSSYKDNLKYTEYLEWTDVWVSLVKDVIKDNGSFFLNVGSKPSDPYTAFDVLNVCRRYFKLQNTIHWIKSIYLENIIGENGKEIVIGHFKPINSDRFINDLHEFIFHFTKFGNVTIDRLSLGAPYKHPSNFTRWKGKKGKTRCRGNIWYIPYKTVVSKKIHPAQFPPELAENCIKLAGYNENTVVLDPFNGVGNTGISCVNLGCKYIGIDIDEVYLKHTIKNIELTRKNNLQPKIP